MIAVILDKSSGQYSPGQEEEEVAKCISKAIRETEPTVQIVPPEEFRRLAFRDLTPAQLPAGEQQWIDLALDAAFRDRIAPLDIRYLIIVEGVTKQDLKLEGAGGPTTGGALWVGGQRYSNYSATMVDLKRPVKVGWISATAWGKSFIPILPLPPIPVIPATLSRACNELGEQVAAFLVGEKPPAETAGDQAGRESAKPPIQENSPQSEQEQGPRQ